MRMSPGRLFILGLLTLFCSLVLVSATAWAGGGHGEDADISETVDVDGKSGVSLFLANLYNDHRFLYALLVTAVMAILGMAVAQVADVVLRAVGAQKR
ncbi:MAG: hypothetical protein GY867_08960 [bacterium]|nr:hypothetical protein [bacterium]